VGKKKKKRKGRGSVTLHGGAIRTLSACTGTAMPEREEKEKKKKKKKGKEKTVAPDPAVLRPPNGGREGGRKEEGKKKKDSLSGKESQEVGVVRDRDTSGKERKGKSTTFIVGRQQRGEKRKEDHGPISAPSSRAKEGGERLGKKKRREGRPTLNQP